MAVRFHPLAVHARRPVLVIVDEQEVTVVAIATGEILSTHRIEPDRGYWRNPRRLKTVVARNACLAGASHPSARLAAVSIGLSLRTPEPAWLWAVAVRYLRFLGILFFGLLIICIAFDIAWVVRP